MTGSTPPPVSHSPPAEPPGDAGDTRSAGTGPLRRRFRWPSPRTVLWLHIGVVCYTGAVVHLSIRGILWVPGFNASDPAQPAFPGELVGGLLVASAIWLFFAIFLFPPVLLVSICVAPPSRRLLLSVLVEALLVLAHFLAINPLVGCYGYW